MVLRSVSFAIAVMLVLAACNSFKFDNIDEPSSSSSGLSSSSGNGDGGSSSSSSSELSPSSGDGEEAPSSSSHGLSSSSGNGDGGSSSSSSSGLSSSTAPSSNSVAMCGELIFDSSRDKFCYDGVLYDKCNGTIEYNPSVYICKDGVAVPAKCNGESYNPLTQDCCNGESYNLLTQGCCKGINKYSTILKHYEIEKPQFCDERDGETYVYVSIGTQTWMAENLKYNASNSKCYPDGVSADSSNKNCAAYGRLYNWATAMELETSCNTMQCYPNTKNRGVCPEGWHIPNDAEWTVLTDFVGSSAGTKF